MSKIPAKDTIYIDVEDEITAIIDKLRHSPAKVVALVLPKRASALQSVVNLKLLQRTAKDAKKNIVLITSDANVLPLAGAVGLHVAKTAQSKPAIPTVPKASDAAITVDSDDELGDDDTPLDKSAPVGLLAGALAAEEMIEVDNESLTSDSKKKKVAAGKSDRKFRIPNFDKFRTRLFLGIGAFVLLIILWVLATMVLPKATITIKTDTSVVNSRLSLNGDTEADTLDTEKAVVPVVTKELKKVTTEKTAATGERNDGTKASGTMTLRNCIFDGQSYTIPAGTGFTSDGKTFVTNASVDLGVASYSSPSIPDGCTSPTKQVGVTAVNAGEDYNLSARSYGVPAAYNTDDGPLQANGSAMTGGTSKITKVVSQQNIDSARQAALDKVKEEANTELAAQMTSDQLVTIADTFSEGKPIVSNAPKVNEPASEVSVTVTVTYTQLGLKKADLTQLIENDVKKQIDTSKQVVQNTGVDEASVRITDRPSKTQLKLEIESVAVAGPQLDGEGIKQEVAGKKKGQTKDIISARPGVQDVQVSYSPFWVFSTPSKASRITIVFNQE